MDCREFLFSGGGATLASLLPETRSSFLPRWTSTGNQTLEVVTGIEILKPSGPTRVWVPTAVIVETPYQKRLTNSFHAESGTAQLVESKADGLGMLVAKFLSRAKPVLTVTTSIDTRITPLIFRKPVRKKKPNRARLFGSWEMNWMAYNYAHDVTFPGSKRGSIGFLMYPQAETEADSSAPSTLTNSNMKFHPAHFRTLSFAYRWMSDSQNTTE